MSGIVNSVVEVGTFGLVDDVTGVEGQQEAAIKAGELQAAASERGIEEQRRQFDTTTKDLRTASQQNRQDLQRGRHEAFAELRSGQEQQREALTTAQAENAARLQAGGDAAIQSLRAGEAGQFEQLDPFARGGVGALEQQQAMLGLGTPEQQQAAFNSFSESPGQKFIRDRAQKNLLRNQSAIGGLGGGNVRSALVEQGAGFAAQDFGNQFNRLSDLRTAGQNAATNIGQGALSTGANVANTQLGTAQNIGAGALNTAANIGQGALTTGGNLASTAFNAKQLAGAGAINTAARQGQFGQNMATNVANLGVAASEARASGLLGAAQADAQFTQGLMELGGTAAGIYASDKRLKDNIEKVGEANGFNWYTWTWNTLGNSLGLFGESEGVIAQEVLKEKPHLISESNGFMKVNYQGLGV